MQWWDLPGPRRFIDRVVSQLRDGRNVILSLPSYTAYGLRRAVRAQLSEVWLWHDVSPLTTDEQDIAVRLFTELLPARQPPRYPHSAYAV